MNAFEAHLMADTLANEMLSDQPGLGDYQRWIGWLATLDAYCKHELARLTQRSHVQGPIACATCGRVIEPHELGRAQLTMHVSRALHGTFQQWLPHHHDCLPQDFTPYGVPLEATSDLTALEKWNRHLSEKRWIVNTDWQHWHNYFRIRCLEAINGF